MINGLTRAAHIIFIGHIPYKSAIIFPFRLVPFSRINLDLVLHSPVVDDYYCYLLYTQLLDAYVFIGFNVINHCKLHFCRVLCAECADANIRTKSTARCYKSDIIPLLRKPHRK